MKTPIAVAGLLLILAVPGQAGTVYRWVNQAGGVEFSDVPPTDPTVEVQILNIDVPAVSASPEVAARREQMREVADRLAQERRDREDRRSRERIAQMEAAAVAEPTVVYERTGSYPLWWGRPRPPHVRPWPPGHRPPMARPPTTKPISPGRPRHFPAATAKWTVSAGH